MQTVECVVIGAGVVGLACARALAQKNIEVVIVEAQESIGTGTSSRNSEVIHAGIYYPNDSLKAKLCVTGNSALYAYCRENNVGFKNIGKLIVATDEQEVAALEKIHAHAKYNGANLEWLSAGEVSAMEPELTVARGLYSPTTGIIDSHALMHSLLGDAESLGAMLAVNSKVVAVEIVDNGFKLTVDNEEIYTKYLVNSAGLQAHIVAATMLGYPADKIPQVKFCKGNYFVLNGQSPFEHLIYPVPEANGLGIHSTLDLAGTTRFGPDTEWVDNITYQVTESSKDKFINSIARYWPQVRERELSPGYVGIRAKATIEHAGVRHINGDFIILGSRQHGINGLVQLFGIESPGLTSCLTIAEYVADLVMARSVVLDTCGV